ncbi:MAG: hypothetical protein DDT26_00664 [Dehalococcoidia bacterium]|nr:hypothetical protein [Chloroflexota bacterium]
MSVFASQIAKAARDGVTVDIENRKSWAWLKANYAAVSKRAGTYSAIKNSTQEHGGIIIGRMYQFKYDPKTKDRMPFWDTFPLVLPVDRAKGGFFGINFHYLPLRERAILLDRLYDYANNDRMDDSTKLRVSYGLLSRAASLKSFQPAFKRYLYTHMRSNFLYIEPENWLTALFIPSERFKGATTKTVWKHTKNNLS